MTMKILELKNWRPADIFTEGAATGMRLISFSHWIHHSLLQS
jgi:hypothetical protein